jgi:hypothetical protein
LKVRLFLLISALLITGCGTSDIFIHDTDAGIKHIKANIEFLASDELEGRGSATRGEKVASLFIASELQKYGVKPFGDNGTYFQNFDVKLQSYSDESTIAFVSSGEETELKIWEDFLLYSGSDPDGTLKNSELEIVFAGYGITAEEYGYDDYKNIDVTGKAVLVLSGEPYSDEETFFAGSRLTRYSRSSSKISTAVSNGAAAVIVIPDPYLAGRWEAYKSYFLTPKFIYPADKNLETRTSIPYMVLTIDAAKIMLIDENKNYADLSEYFSIETPPSSFDIEKKVKINIKSFEQIESIRNVVGVIEGTDPGLKNQYVSLGAHYDHEGIKNGEIYYGADDNASGTSAILEAARTLSLSNDNKRSVVFIFHAAEEKGLIGASHFTNSSEIINDIVVNINLDMIGQGNVDTLLVIGSDRLAPSCTK